MNIKLIGISFYNNSKSQKKFNDHLDAHDELIYLFHGSSNCESLIFNGLSSKLIGATDDGYFGKGYYFTSFIDYALLYHVQNLFPGLKRIFFIFLIFLINMFKRCKLQNT